MILKFTFLMLKENKFWEKEKLYCFMKILDKHIQMKKQMKKLFLVMVNIFSDKPLTKKFKIQKTKWINLKVINLLNQILF